MYLATVPLDSPDVCLEKWYLRAKYLFLVDILGTLTKERHPWLSANAVDCVKVVGECFNSILDWISWRGARMCRTSPLAMLNATYYVAVELRV